MERAIVVFKMIERKQSLDIDIPLDISANDLVLALNSAFGLKIDTLYIKNCYLKSENPIALLRGSQTLKEYGIRDGSIIIFSE